MGAECSTNLPNSRSHLCTSSHVLIFPLNTGRLFWLFKPCHLVTCLLWDARGSLFDIFCYSKSTAMLTFRQFSTGLDPENHKHASHTKRDIESFLRDPYTNKTPQTKKGGFKAAWRMSVVCKLIRHCRRNSSPESSCVGILRPCALETSGTLGRLLE